jgi:hypothetical protein
MKNLHQTLIFMRAAYKWNVERFFPRLSLLGKN